MKKLIFLLIIIILQTSCSYINKKHIRYNNFINSILENEQYSYIYWGINIESIKNHKVVFQRNSDKLFIPASNQKIITAATALINLKPDYRIPTRFFYEGIVKDSILKGNLIVQGFGDPTLSHDFYNDPREMFYSWADSLNKYGIKEINGNLVGDDDVFDDVALGRGWMLEDLKYPFAAETGALQFNDNSISFSILPPAKENKTAIIIPTLRSSYFQFNNEITCLRDSLDWLKINRASGSNLISVEGNLQPLSPARSRSISLSNPTKYFLTTLKETFSTKGISINGDILDCDEITDWHLDSLDTTYLFETNSIKLSDIIANMMEKSSNLQAETLIKLLAVNAGDVGSTGNGNKIVQEFMSDLQISSDSYQFVDGSGLSRYNLISPKQITEILKFMLNTEYSEQWLNSFPVTGNYDSNLGLTFGKKHDGNILAKTGTMSNIRCLSGYIEVPDDTLVFSILVNCHLLNAWKIDLLNYTILSYVLENI